MISIDDVIKILIIIVIIWLFYKFLSFLLRKLRKKPFLSYKVKSKADRKFYKLLNRFKMKYHREPDKGEKFRIAINASHITIRRRGKGGHWGRQKVRKYLLEKHNIVKKYTIR